MIWGLFILSYALFYGGEGLWLAIIYPVAISYYNVLLFQTLIQTHNIRVIGIAMVGVGWIAASAANAVALYHQLWIVVAALGLFSLAYPFYFRRIA